LIMPGALLYLGRPVFAPAGAASHLGLEPA
jgi:hypothetical protein